MHDAAGGVASSGSIQYRLGTGTSTAALLSRLNLPEWLCCAYRQLDPVRDAVVAKLRGLIRAGAGTEARRSALMQMGPEDVGLKGEGQERIVNHFKVSVLSDGSGAQFFSTTFVQWAAREVLRRAQPVTLWRDLRRV